ncbi:MAG TPA: hypothetical protein VJ508_00495 [Saprospiraceae bacterium]|nr:hypothetical protein [Saprospiraceae bacterium]
MKKILIMLAIYSGLALVLTLVSCSKGDSTVSTQTDVQNHVQSGTWQITSFIDSGKDETSHFQGYSFTFGANNVLTATNNNGTVTGTWSTVENNGYYGDAGTVSMILQFNLTNDFESLSEDWLVVSQSSTRIELKHVSGGNGGTDYLTFEKI